MKVMFVCMGSMLAVYAALARELKKRCVIESASFYVSDRRFYKKYIKSNDLEGSVLGEWELLSRDGPYPSDEKLREIEEKYFDDEPYSFSMLADRRIYNGKYTKVKQDYKASYSHDEMLSLFGTANIMLENFIKKEAPDLILGVTPSTFGDYLCYKHALANGIKYLQLRPTKLLNFCTLSEDIFESHAHIQKQFHDFKKGINQPTDGQIKLVREYLDAAQQKRVVYEGNIGITNIYTLGVMKNLKDLLRSILLDISMLGKQRDNHQKALYTKVYLHDRVRRIMVQRILYLRHSKKSLTNIDQLPDKFFFFPLHAEPEISLTIFSRENLNQIEVIRQLALNLPVGHKLIIKEHPRNVGRRSLHYYKKMLEIPGVVLAHHSMSSAEIIKNSKLVIVLSSFVGFEAALLRKPVITLGRIIYNMLPESMVVHCEKFQDLHEHIKTLTSNYNYDRRVLEAFLCAVASQSARLDLYTILLRKENREGGSSASDGEFERQIGMFADFLSKRITGLGFKTDHGTG